MVGRFERVSSIKPPFSFKSREGKDLVKREITLADDTATSIDITIWGDRAQQPDSQFESNPVMAFKGVIVKEWNGGRSFTVRASKNCTNPSREY